MVVVNAFKTDKIEYSTEEMLLTLNSIREKILAMPEGAARITRLSAHFFMQRDLRRILGVTRLPDYLYTASGRPYLKGVHFSLSHTDGAAAYVISDKNCAVDIEPLTRRFSPALMRRIGAETDDPLSIWCKKECLAKLTGGSVLGQNPDNGNFQQFDLSGYLCLYIIK